VLYNEVLFRELVSLVRALGGRKLRVYFSSKDCFKVLTLVLYEVSGINGGVSMENCNERNRVLIVDSVDVTKFGLTQG